MASEAPDGGRRWSKIGILLVIGSVGYLVLLWVGTHLPSGSAPGIGNLDKLIHATAYCGLAILFMSAGVQFLRISLSVVLAFVGILLALAACDELLQIPVPGRNADIFDFVADATGIFVGVGLVAVATLLMRPKSP